ncbi:putative protein-serine/threonine kinase [Helianthus annuus]|nr:putative protein-serine/threonine kinase [Helianthus annuus]
MADLDNLLGKKVADRYLKREVLGEGTYGVVYKAIDTKGVSGAYNESAAEKEYTNCKTIPCEQFDIAFQVRPIFYSLSRMKWTFNHLYL